MAKLKAEFMQHYYDANGVPFRSKLVANFSKISKFGSLFPALYNFGAKTPGISHLIKLAAGFALKRSMPTLHKTTLAKWYRKHKTENDREPETNKRKVYLFCDEFTNYNDTLIGITTIALLERLGYEVEIPAHVDSGRASLSKGLIREGKKIANQNITMLSGLINEETPLIGIEPSAILTFRDEYIDLATDENFEAAKKLSKNVFLIDEFIALEIDKGNIKKEQFTKEAKTIKLHGHCQQKAWGALNSSVKALSFPENYKVETIPSGCCGMAGSFGFEKEHYDISMKIGELVLFPTIRQQPDNVIIAAPGTSCRHQIKDGTQRHALHPAEVLFNALV
jgi:Fe-S oxidoreductase